MNELFQKFNAAGIRYLLIGGQAMRLVGLARSTMDWDFFIPPRDEANLTLLNNVLENWFNTVAFTTSESMDQMLINYFHDVGLILGEEFKGIMTENATELERKMYGIFTNEAVC